jgi:hypothetical protein
MSRSLERRGSQAGRARSNRASSPRHPAEPSGQSTNATEPVRGGVVGRRSPSSLYPSVPSRRVRTPRFRQHPCGSQPTPNTVSEGRDRSLRYALAAEGHEVRLARYIGVLLLLAGITTGFAAPVLAGTARLSRSAFLDRSFGHETDPGVVSLDGVNPSSTAFQVFPQPGAPRSSLGTVHRCSMETSIRTG